MWRLILMVNDDVVKNYRKMSRKDLVRGIKECLKRKDRFRTKADGFGNDKGNGLRRPKIGGVYYSWSQFIKLPIDVIIVYAFMNGCTPKFLENLKDEGFWIPFHVKHKDERIIRCGERWVVVEDNWKLGDSLKGDMSTRWN